MLNPQSTAAMTFFSCCRCAETPEPILDVSGVARLWHLAVVNDVEAGLQLPADAELYDMRHLAIEGGRVKRQPVLTREHEKDVGTP